MFSNTQQDLIAAVERLHFHHEESKGGTMIPSHKASSSLSTMLGNQQGSRFTICSAPLQEEEEVPTDAWGYFVDSKVDHWR